MQLGLRTELTFKEIKPLMKAFRQEINNLESPVKEVSRPYLLLLLSLIHTAHC